MADKKLLFFASVQKRKNDHGTFLDLITVPPVVEGDNGKKKRNPNCKAVLLVQDLETGKQYQIKQAEFKGVSENARKHGFINSLAVDLNNKYHVKELKK